MFEVSGVDNSNNPIAANLFVIGSITGSAYGFTASVGVQMCLVNGEDTSQCFPTTPDLLFQQSGWLDACCLCATCVASGTGAVVEGLRGGYDRVSPVGGP